MQIIVGINNLRFCLLIILQISGWTYAQNWNQITDFPGTQRDDGTSFVIGNTSYCGTGNLPWGVGTIDFYALDMSDDSWNQIASLPAGEERQYACGFSSATHGYIFGGYNAGNFFNDLWQYDPISNTWLEKTPLPDVGRSASAYFVIGDTAYFVCGKTATDYAINEVWAYNMTNDTWQQKNNFPFGNRWRSCGIASPTKGYLIFGKDETFVYPTALYEFDPLTNSWIQISNFPGIGRTHSKAVFYGGNIVLLSGYDSLNISYNDMWRYDLADNLWFQLNAIPAVERRAGMCFTNSVALYYTAGINSSNGKIKETWKNINPTEISENPEELFFDLFPNPANSKVNLTFNQVKNFEILSIIIYDLSGKEIFCESNPGNLKTLEIDVSEFESGTYLINILTTEFSTTKKLIVL